MMQMGFGMEGIEERIEAVAKDVATRFDEITYIEIGVAEGKTLTAIASTLRASGKRWRAIGIELPNGYSFSREATEDFARLRNLKLNFITPDGSIAQPLWERITVYLKDSQSFLTELWHGSVQFALIDGCHGKPCVSLDFLALEAFAVVKSVIMFHDFGEDLLGASQPHCPTGCDVRGACYDLGLLTNKRTNWKFNETFVGDRTKGGSDMGVFEKVA
jgi:hypothetical protein